MSEDKGILQATADFVADIPSKIAEIIAPDNTSEEKDTHQESAPRKENTKDQKTDTSNDHPSPKKMDRKSVEKADRNFEKDFGETTQLDLTNNERSEKMDKVNSLENYEKSYTTQAKDMDLDESDVTTVGHDVTVDDEKLRQHSESFLTASGNKTHIENPSVFDYVKEEDPKDFGSPSPNNRKEKGEEDEKYQPSLAESTGEVLIDAELAVEKAATTVVQKAGDAVGAATEFIKDKAEAITHAMTSEEN